MDRLRLANMLTSSALNYVMLLASLTVLIKFHEDLQMWTDFLGIQQRRDYLRGQEREAFDFVIIGGGSAGSVVANRLSENFNVLVLEIGGDPSPLSQVPLLADNLYGSEMTFTYATIPQRNCCRNNVDQVVRFPRGKGLGGSSNINGMMYIRGNPRDYDRWAQLTQDSSWTYENVLPYFKKSEDYHGNYEPGNIHVSGGALYVGKLDFEPPVKETFLAAVAEKGYVQNDINALRGPGFSHPEVNIKNGRRFTSYPAFIQPILRRKTLTIYRYSRAMKIHLDQTKRAIGVTYIRHGQTHFVEAKKEVIVSAGVIDSPRLLLLSGIGPRAHLREVGIKPEVDLPVGQNYHDHFMTRATILLDKPVSIINERNLTASAIYEYVNDQKGPLSSTHSRVGIGLITSPSLVERDWPDLYTIIGGQGIEQGFTDSALNGTYDAYYGPHVGKDACQVFCALLRPNGPRGELKLASSNPDDPPIIDPKIFADPSDLRRMAQGIMFMVNLFETTRAFRTLNARVPPNPFPGCENVPFKTLEYWECYISHVTFAGFHPVGTCKMGNPADRTAVVDSKLRVLGTKGLRVIDGSIMPIIMTGNPYAPTLMIAELGSDFIKEEWAKDQGQRPPLNGGRPGSRPPQRPGLESRPGPPESPQSPSSGTRPGSRPSPRPQQRPGNMFENNRPEQGPFLQQQQQQWPPRPFPPYSNWGQSATIRPIYQQTGPGFPNWDQNYNSRPFPAHTFNGNYNEL